MSNSTPSKAPSKSSNPSTYYIDKEEMVKEVIKSRETGVMTDKLARMILLLAEKISYRHCFIGYSYREDMVADAVLNLVCGALKFDPSKSSNPFGYYTIAVHRSFIHFLHVEKRHRYIRDKLLLELGESPSFGFLEDHKGQFEDPEIAKSMMELREDIDRARKDPTPAPGEKRKKTEATNSTNDVNALIEDENADIDAEDLDDETFDEYVDEQAIETEQEQKDKRRKRATRHKQNIDVVDSEINRELLIYQ